MRDTTADHERDLLRTAAQQLTRDAAELHARCAYGAGDEAADVANTITSFLKEGEYVGD